MNELLRKSIDGFYDEKEEKDVFELVDLATAIVPQLDSLVKRLESKIFELEKTIVTMDENLFAEKGC